MSDICDLLRHLDDSTVFSIITDLEWAQHREESRFTLGPPDMTASEAVAQWLEQVRAFYRKRNEAATQ